MLIPSTPIPTALVYAENRDRAVKAAEPMAKPFL